MGVVHHMLLYLCPSEPLVRSTPGGTACLPVTTTHAHVWHVRETCAVSAQRRAVGCDKTEPPNCMRLHSAGASPPGWPSVTRYASTDTPFFCAALSCFTVSGVSSNRGAEHDAPVDDCSITSPAHFLVERPQRRAEGVTIVSASR
jgi:hypothetical protein